MRKGLLMKRVSIFLSILLITLTACQSNENPVENSDPVNDQKTSIQFDESNYPILLPYEPGVAASYVSAMSRSLNRIDIQNIEDGMMFYAKTKHSTSTHIFTEGQFIDTDLIREFIKKELILGPDEEINEEVINSEESILGLNPPVEQLFTEDNIPIDNVVLFLNEQNYLINSENTFIIDGLTVGVVMDQTPTFDLNGETVTKELSDIEMRTIAKQVNDKLILHLRDIKGLEKTSIQVLNYAVESEKELVPGKFFYETFSGRDGSETSRDLSETVYLVPSYDYGQDYPDLQEAFSSMLDDIRESFPTYVSTIGYMKRIENTISHLDFTVNVTFTSQSKLYSVAQIYTDLIQKYFPGNYELTVVIYSTEKCEIILRRKPGETDIEMITLN
jgi:protein involved in sex pheromone biosynthesis